MRHGLRLPSGRVIAIGRYMLATLFLLAIWMDDSQPSKAQFLTYFVIVGYVCFALAVVGMTWNDWWRDARLAGTAHAVDVTAFTFLVFSTAGYTSPFFPFFIFVLLSAAIRWGWRATALTAVLLTLLFLLAGLAVSWSTTEFELQRFVIRTGHLVIMSLILIWFGVNQWRSGIYARDEVVFAEPSLEKSSFETGLRAAMEGLKALRGVFVWREHGADEATAFVASGGEIDVSTIKRDAIANPGATPFLYDLRRGHALTRDAQHNLCPLSAHAAIRPEAARALHLNEGIAIPISTAAGDGELFLEGLPNLSVDHIDLGELVAADVADHIQRHALIKAVEENAEARSRVGLAGDLHDSVVQFLAGAAFRVEALKREQALGHDVGPDLEQLKQLMLQEQGELRAFIAALRSGPQIELVELATNLRELSAKLSRQWDVTCEFSSEARSIKIPARLHMDAEHLVREAVANAVRHAGATSISIKLRAEPTALLMDFINNGARYPQADAGGGMPRSMSERVKLAGGALELSRGLGVTRISVSLPLGGRLQ